MSLEQSFERIAKALEELVEVTKVQLLTPIKPVEPKKTPGTRTKGGKRLTKKSEGIQSTSEDHLHLAAKADAKAELGDVEPWCTEEELRVTIREYAATFGKSATTELIVKYGAKAEKPLIADVDKRRYKELTQEIKTELEKGN
jgi:hypothetical protein